MTNNVDEKVLYQQDEFPIFQNRIYETREEAKACHKGNILLVENQKTGLIYNAVFSQKSMQYDSNYQNEQATSLFFQRHLDSVFGIIKNYLYDGLVVEIGCGKGFFLEKLNSKGVNIIGYDPTYEGKNKNIIKDYFSKESVKKTGELLILRHVLEHIQDPFDFLIKIKESNGGSGKIYIEVPCFEWICNHKAWFDIFYEHVNYFRISNFFAMFGSIIDSGFIFEKQYIFVVAELSTLKEPKFNPNNSIKFPTDFTDGIKNNNLKSEPTVIWGGSSKGVIFSLLKERAGQTVDIVIDINPKKQGKYLPSTGLLVEEPSKALTKIPEGSSIYIMNSNYSNEIKEMSFNKFNYIEIDNEYFQN